MHSIGWKHFDCLRQKLLSSFLLLVALFKRCQIFKNRSFNLSNGVSHAGTLCGLSNNTLFKNSFFASIYIDQIEACWHFNLIGTAATNNTVFEWMHLKVSLREKQQEYDRWMPYLCKNANKKNLFTQMDPCVLFLLWKASVTDHGFCENGSHISTHCWYTV